MATIIRENGYICISYDQKEMDISHADFLNSNTINEAIPVELPLKEKRADLKTDMGEDQGPTLVPDMGKFPYNACGKLIMRFGSPAYIGSASLLKRPDMLLTAAHCVYNAGTKSFPSSTEFAWRLEGQTAYQIEAVTHIFIPAEYEETGDSQYDYAICVLSVPVGDHRNVLDYTTNLSNYETTTIGYPASDPYDGQKMYYTKNSASIYEESGKKYLHVKNGLSYGGASGGPWVFDQKVAGVTSWGWQGFTDALSPQFDQKFDTLYTQAVKKAPLVSISEFKLKNDWGWFVCKLHVQYEDKVYEKNDDIRINCSGTATLKDHVPAFSVVNIKAFVAGGNDKCGSQKFIFDPNVKKGAYYQISGSTLCNSLTYKGMYTPK